jgi:hypothetical protein
MRIVWMIFVPVVLLFCFALIVIWVPLPHPFPPALSQTRNLWAAIMTGILGIGYLGGLTVYLISGLLRAGQVLDPVCLPYGLIASNYGLIGRQYDGQIEGRQVQIRYTPARQQRALFEVYLDAQTGTRAAMGSHRPLLDCRDCARVQHEPLHIYAEAPGWAAQFLSSSTVETTISHLLVDPGSAAAGELYIQPERIWFRAYVPAGDTSALLDAWLQDLLSLAGEVERPPTN